MKEVQEFAKEEVTEDAKQALRELCTKENWEMMLIL